MNYNNLNIQHIIKLTGFQMAEALGASDNVKAESQRLGFRNTLHNEPNFCIQLTCS